MTDIYKPSERLIDGSFSLFGLQALYNNNLLSDKDLEELLDHWTCLQVFQRALPQGAHIDDTLEWLIDNFEHDMYAE